MLGKDAFYPGFIGELAGWTLNFGAGSYQEGNYNLATGPLNFGYNVGLAELNQPVIAGVAVKRRMLAPVSTLDANSNQAVIFTQSEASNDAQIIYSWPAASTKGARQGGFGFWMRVMNRYPSTTYFTDATYHVAKISSTTTPG
jgi:hypothetical protein